MGKIILWVVVVIVVLLVLRMINVAKAARSARESPPPRSDGKAVMVRCVECGVYLPQSEAKDGPRGPCCGDDACRERARQRP